MSWVIALERYNRKMDYSGLYDISIVKGEISVHFSVKCVDALLFTKHSHDALQVFEIMDEQQVAEEEWMYQLERTLRKPFTLWNETYAALEKGEYTEAAALFAKVPSDIDPVCHCAQLFSHSHHIPQLYEKLKAIVESEIFVPTVVDMH